LNPRPTGFFSFFAIFSVGIITALVLHEKALLSHLKNLQVFHQFHLCEMLFPGFLPPKLGRPLEWQKSRVKEAS